MSIISRSLVALARNVSTTLVPYNTVNNSSVISGLLETSFLTMALKRHHIHTLSDAYDTFSLDFDVANGLWSVLKDLSQSIREATDPTLDTFETLSGIIPAKRLQEIGMGAPRILFIERYTQNLLLCSSSLSEIHRLFDLAQRVGRETVEWIAEAKGHCLVAGTSHGWHWHDLDNELFVVPSQFPDSEGQAQIENSEDTDNCKLSVLLTNIPQRFLTQLSQLWQWFYTQSTLLGLRNTQSIIRTTLSTKCRRLILTQWKIAMTLPTVLVPSPLMDLVATRSNCRLGGLC
jgi:hypothetical protein